EVKEALGEREITAAMEAVDTLLDDFQFGAAADRVRKVADLFPEARDWAAELAELERLAALEEDYQRARGALLSGDRLAAVQHIARVVGADPHYRSARGVSAARILDEAVTGVDVAELEALRDRSEARARLRKWLWIGAGAAAAALA